MKQFEYYVYVYLDPRKPANYQYFDQGLGISFEHEPFYVGEGKKNRMYEHLKEAKNDNFENVKGINKYKIRKIRKIWKAGLEPIIYKIFEFQNEQDALNFERILGFLIGRYDQKRGPLTNLVDCGGKNTNLSEESAEKKLAARLKTEKNNPNIRIQAGIKIKFVLNSRPKEEVEKTTKQYKQHYIDDPEKKKKESKRCSDTKINTDPLIKEVRKKEALITKIEKKLFLGSNNKRYVELDIITIFKLYFNVISFNDMVKEYNNTYATNLSVEPFRRFLKVLNFPKNNLMHKKYIYLDFIKENEDKIDWYIENYKRLEEEYYNNKRFQRFKNFIEENLC